MLFVWNEHKNQSNKDKHGIGFEAAASDFDWENAVRVNRTRHQDGEERYAAIGQLEDKIHTVIFTVRGGKVHIISMRRSNKQEERLFYEKR